MTTGGFDKLLTVTDSRYRLSIIVAKRSRQLELGFPNLLAHDEYPRNRDGVSNYAVAVAIQELLLDKGLKWGDALPSDADLIKTLEAELEKTKADDTLYSLTPMSKSPPVTPKAKGAGLSQRL